MKNLNYGLLASIALLSFSCIEEIQLHEVSPATRLVIEGQISNEFKEHTVQVHQSSSFSDHTEPEPASGLQILFSGPNGEYQLKETEPGIYRTDSLAGIPGALYTLRVRDGGTLYEASETMPALPTPFEPASFSSQNGFLDFEFRRHQFGFAEPNRWELHILRDSIPESLQGVDPGHLGQQIGIVVSDDYAYHFTYYTHPNVEVSGLMNFDIPHFYGFQPGFRVIQKKYALTPTYYRYLRAVFMETEWRGTLFVTSPANVRGNFSGDALGFFSAVSVRSISYTPK